MRERRHIIKTAGGNRIVVGRYGCLTIAPFCNCSRAGYEVVLAVMP